MTQLSRIVSAECFLLFDHVLDLYVCKQAQDMACQAKSMELREKLFKALTAAGVEMPFETIQLAPHRVTVDSSADKNGTPL